MTTTDQHYHDVAAMAAQLWANKHASHIYDGKDFGVQVMNVYLTAKAKAQHNGDANAMAAALAALSIPAEILQALAQIAALVQPYPKAQTISAPDVSVSIQ